MIFCILHMIGAFTEPHLDRTLLFPCSHHNWMFLQFLSLLKHQCDQHLTRFTLLLSSSFMLLSRLYKKLFLWFLQLLQSLLIRLPLRIGFPLLFKGQLYHLHHEISGQQYHEAKRLIEQFKCWLLGLISTLQKQSYLPNSVLSQYDWNHDRFQLLTKPVSQFKLYYSYLNYLFEIIFSFYRKLKVVDLFIKCK